MLRGFRWLLCGWSTARWVRGLPQDVWTQGSFSSLETRDTAVYMGAVPVLLVPESRDCGHPLTLYGWNFRLPYLCRKNSKIHLFHYRAAGAKGERRYSSYSFFTLSLEGGEWSASRPGRALPPGKGTHWMGGWVGLRAGLDTEARGIILCPCRGSNPGRPVCSRTLYWLIYPSAFPLHSHLSPDRCLCTGVRRPPCCGDKCACKGVLTAFIITV
jgi:hypothetical protein